MEFSRFLTGGISESAKMPVDLSAVAASVIAWLGVLNTAMSVLAFAFTIVWLGIRIWESDTMKQWRKKGKK